MEQKPKIVILPAEKREQLFEKIDHGTWDEQDEAVLVILKRLMELDNDSNDLNFWSNKESFFLEYGVTDQEGHSYSIERSEFPVITYCVNYKHNDEYLALSARVGEDFEKMFGPMNIVFKRFEYGFNRQNSQAKKIFKNYNNFRVLWQILAKFKDKFLSK